MTTDKYAYSIPAFSGYGIEIEYMIVDRNRLNVRPLTAQLLHQVSGAPTTQVTRGDIGWSNELMLHVLELKNAEPVQSLDSLPLAFHAEIRAINELLAARGAQLMPGGMHPWMNPRTEAHLWRDGNASIYRAFDRIFDCHRHGWANLQSVHLNLPFASDEEFARLHAAVRLALPILPALAASSPWVDGRFSGFMDYRLAVYRDHQSQIPSSMGDCIPEPSSSPDEYREKVLTPMYKEIAAYDEILGEDAGALSHEWLDVRAAVPRFARNAIEVRVLDVQECPVADLAIAAASAALVHRLYNHADELPVLNTRQLVSSFDVCIRDAEHALLTDIQFLQALGAPAKPVRAGELWSHLVNNLIDEGLLSPLWLPALRHIFQHGTLARRITNALDGDPSRLPEVYRELADCLQGNRMYQGGVRERLRHAVNQ